TYAEANSLEVLHVVAAGCRHHSRRDAGATTTHRKSSPANSARSRRQTIQVCIPGVSISVCCTPLDFSHSRRFRFTAIRRSSVPQAIQSKRSCWFAFASSEGKSVRKELGMPPELYGPSHAHLSRLFR